MHRIQNGQVTKPAVRTARGAVASQSLEAAALGARALAAGGNAVDAAVVTGLAMNAAEPWMSGIGGGGFMVVYGAAERRVRVVDFTMVSPAGLDPAAYPVVGGVAEDAIFPWPAVKDNRNNTGPLSIAVPGNVDGLGLALETFGTLSWHDAVQPAVALARRGLPRDWWTTLNIATAAAELRLFETSAATYLPDGLPPVPAVDGSDSRLPLGRLADTLDHLADHGRRAFYDGDLAQAIAADVQAGGGSLSADDLAGYRAAIVDPLVCAYGDAAVHLVPGLSGGPTMALALDHMAQAGLAGTAPGPAAFAAYYDALRQAYDARLRTMGHGGDGGRSCTTHITAVDGAGNMVALTQTLLARFGSKVVLPQTGILMNNGIAWFDPEPGRPNSLAPAARPLANMCPVVATRDGAPWFALGASGGRRIVPAVTQLTSFLTDFGMDADAAWHQPRIDVSSPEAATYDPRHGADVVSALQAVGPAGPGELCAYPALYACPNGAVRQAGGTDGGWELASDVMSPWSGVATAEEAA